MASYVWKHWRPLLCYSSQTPRNTPDTTTMLTHQSGVPSPFFKSHVRDTQPSYFINRSSSNLGKRKEAYVNFPQKCSLMNKKRKYQSHESTINPKRYLCANEQGTKATPMPMSPEVAVLVGKACFVVVDTNCWITSLEMICSLALHRQLTVVVPTVVLQELDGLKADKEHLGFKARMAIKIIHDAISSGQTWCRGQRYNEQLSDNSFRASNNDDLVLSCALYFQQTIAPSVLVTSDYGLAAKALINRVPTTDMKGLLESLPAISMLNVPEQPQPQSFSQDTVSKEEDKAQSELQTSEAFSNDDASTQNSINAQITSPVSLPLDVQERIYSFLPPRALLRLSCVCRALRQTVCSQEGLWMQALSTHLHVRPASIFNNNNQAVMMKKGSTCTSARLWYIQWAKRVLPPNKL